MATVWLINKGGHNYESLKEYGVVIPITDGGVNPFNPDRLWATIDSKLRLAEPGDWVAISGLQMLNGVVFVYWIKKFGEINLLQWSVGKKKYIPLLFKPPMK